MVDQDPSALDIWSDIGTSHQSLHTAVTDSLRQAILSGAFKPGERLTESNLAKMFVVSRNPIREALRSLQVEGLVEINPRRGARVKEVAPEELDEIIELRAELEALNAANAARRCDEHTRKRMRELLTEGNAAAERLDIEALKGLNDRFHYMLGDAGRNRYLADYVRTLRERTLWVFGLASEVRIVDSWKEHAQILNAVVDADAELASLLAARHVRAVGELVHATRQVNRQP